MKMTAMKKLMINNSGGDDEYYRLLSYLDSKFPDEIINMTKVRDFVFIIETPKNVYVVKGYSTLNKLRLQEAFTSSLKKEGFTKTYTFLQVSNEPLFFEGKYYGCMEYLTPHPDFFSFSSNKDRMGGMKVIKEFHFVTSTFVSRYRALLPLSDIQAKWLERFEIFKQNYSFFKNFLKEKDLQEMMMWANWSLKGMKDHEGYFLESPKVILHGDVAHHNFLRDTRGKINLIDFDLISIGPKSLDLLQYANRIMPFLNWSLDDLYQYPDMQPYLKQAAFLYALAYPADIFREWNRLIREKSYSNPAKLRTVIDLTIGQFSSRRRMAEILKSTVK